MQRKKHKLSANNAPETTFVIARKRVICMPEWSRLAWACEYFLAKSSTNRAGTDTSPHSPSAQLSRSREGRFYDLGKSHYPSLLGGGYKTLCARTWFSLGSVFFRLSSLCCEKERKKSLSVVTNLLAWPWQDEDERRFKQSTDALSASSLKLGELIQMIATLCNPSLMFVSRL